jgi:hypothetical protein
LHSKREFASLETNLNFALRFVVFFFGFFVIVVSGAPSW